MNRRWLGHDFWMFFGWKNGSKLPDFDDFLDVFGSTKLQIIAAPLDLWLRVEAASSSPWFWRQGHRFPTHRVPCWLESQGKTQLQWTSLEKQVEQLQNTIKKQFRNHRRFFNMLFCGSVKGAASLFRRPDHCGLSQEFWMRVTELLGIHWEPALETTPAIQKARFIYLQEIFDWLGPKFISDWSWTPIQLTKSFASADWGHWGPKVSPSTKWYQGHLLTISIQGMFRFSGLKRVLSFGYLHSLGDIPSWLLSSQILIAQLNPLFRLVLAG